MLPSIVDVSFELEISRDTAEKGYNILIKSKLWNPFPSKVVL
jgi:hypothetical protein